MFLKTWAGLGWADRRRCDVAGDVWVDRGACESLGVSVCASCDGRGGAGGVPPAGFWAAYLPWRADSGPAARICPGGQIAAAPS